MRLIFCLGANRVYPALARAAGWHIGARLPATLYDDHQPLAFADQDWRKFDGLQPDDPRYERAFGRYIAALGDARPTMASVLDWTPDRSRDEVLIWATAAAEHTTEAVMIVPKTPGTIASIPPQIGGRRVVLGFSVPTRHGAQPESADNNGIQKSAGYGTFWERGRSRNLGRHMLTTQEALERSLAEVPRLWRSAGWTIESEVV